MTIPSRGVVLSLADSESQNTGYELKDIRALYLNIKEVAIGALRKNW